MKGGHSQPAKPGSPASTRKWRSAGEQFHADLPFGPEFRRLSEWPIAAAQGEYRLSRMDQVSITIELKTNHRSNASPLPAPNELLPRTRLSILCAGQASPVTTLMLLKGARRVEAVHFGFEPILVLCEFNTDPSALGMPSFPAMLTRQELADVLADPEALIDGLVWYDIGDERTYAYLERLKMIRKAAHPGCPIVTLKPCDGPPTAEAEFAALRSGSGLFLAAADELYRQVKQAIAECQDREATTPLRQLLKGGVAVFFDTNPHDI